MKNFYPLLLLVLLTSPTFSQNCTADFTYTIGNNNVVTFNNTTSFNCSPNSSVYYGFNFDDTASGNFNFGNIFGGSTHFFKSPGVYDVCYYANSSTGEQNCICHDSICQQITITSTGSNCQANYCYNAIDAGGYMSVSFSNFSTADDSIVDVYWDYGDGIQSIEYNPDHIYFTLPSSVDFICNLYIETANGCQSVVTDTIKLGNHCTQSVTSVSIVDAPSIKVFPTVISSQFTIQVSEIKENMSFQLFDILGRPVTQVALNSTQTEIKRHNTMASGNYIYRILSGDAVVKTGKLVLE